MKRTTIFVPEALERDLQLYARRQGKPTAAIVREALAAYIMEKSPGNELPSFAGAFDSGFTDTAERQEEILFKGLSPHGTPAAPSAVVRLRSERTLARPRRSLRGGGKRAAPRRAASRTPAAKRRR